MNISSETVVGLVNAEVGRASTAEVAALMRRLLIPPRCEERPWDYGPGESYPCWIVAEHTASNTCIAYCDQGFGPGRPWGLLSIAGSHLNIGMDSGWFHSLEEAVLDSFAADELTKARPHGA